MFQKTKNCRPHHRQFPQFNFLEPRCNDIRLASLAIKKQFTIESFKYLLVPWNRMHKWMCISLTLGNLTLAVWALLFFMPTHRYYLRTGLLKSFVNMINLLSAIEPKHE